jgi:phosphoserine phosphatase
VHALSRGSSTALGSGAVFRLEGAVTSCRALAAAAHIAASAPSVRQRLMGRAMTTLGAGLGLASPLKDPRAGARLAWASLRGLSRDRVEVLALDFAREQVLPSVRPEARRLIDHARRDGATLVLVSDGLDVVARAVAAELEIAHVLANTLVYEREEATGELAAPIVGPEIDAQRLGVIAREWGIDLARSSAYGSSAGDALLLSHVARPCAVAPERELARMARDLGWPIVGAVTNEDARERTSGRGLAR